jgi:hypothetical protein
MASVKSTPGSPISAPLLVASVDAGGGSAVPNGAAGETDEIPVAVEAVPPAAASGTLTVVAPTGTDVFLDGTHLARAPFAALPVPAGRHGIRLRNQDRGIDRQEWVNVTVGGETVLRRTAEQLLASARTTSDDAGRDAGPAGGTATADASLTRMFQGLPDDFPAAPSAPADAGARPDAPRIRTRYGDGGRTP